MGGKLGLPAANGSSCPVAVIGGATQRVHLDILWRPPFDNTESRLGGRERHVVGHDRLGEALEGERANLFGYDASP